MKKTIKYLSALSLVFWFTQCNLNTELMQKIETDKAFVGVQDVQNALNGAYQQFGDYKFYGTYVPAIGDMASDVSVASSSSGHFVSFNGWTFDEYTTELEDVWSGGYKVLDRCVRGINGGLALLATPDKFSATDISKLNSYVSQMYALRAMTSFTLVNLFGLPYQAGSANSQLGIVLITTKPIEAFATVSRATVAQTYTQILADIAKAKEYMVKLDAESKAGINQYYFNEAAIYAMEARVKLYMHDYAGAKVAAQSAIDLRNSGDETFESYVAMWKTTAITKEDIFTIVKSDNDNLSADALNTLYGSYGGTVSVFTTGAFATTDIRTGLISGDNGDHPAKFDGTATAQAVSNIPVFRKSEMYLILAECNLLSTTVDIPAAQNALLYSAKRNTAITAVTDLPSTKAALITFLSAERVREFFEEGYRWFDLRRTGEKVEIGSSASFDMSKFVFPIPGAEVDAGFGVLQNTTWADMLP